MAQSVAALYHGWEYQAHLLWIHAWRIFQNRPTGQQVGFEWISALSFDDVTVHCEGPFEAGEPVGALDRSRTGSFADTAPVYANRLDPAVEEQ
jgi:hypothetical protein